MDDTDWDEASMDCEADEPEWGSDDPAWDRFEQELKDEEFYPTKSLSEQRFLGAGEALPVLDECQNAAAAAAALAADGPGVVRLKHVLSAPLATELREFALSELRQARHELAESPGVGSRREVRLSNVLASGLGGSRWDVRLPMRSVVRRALRELLGEGSALGGALELLGGGGGAELWELSAMISSPGAAAQILHADCDGAPNPPLLHTAFWHCSPSLVRPGRRAGCRPRIATRTRMRWPTHTAT